MCEVLVFINPYLDIYVKSFLIKTHSHNIFIDSGLFTKNKALLEHAKDGRKNIILATHGHWDHIGMHATLVDTGATLYAHLGDAKYYTNYSWHWKVLFGQFLKDIVLPKERELIFWNEIGNEVTPTVSVKDGDILTIDNCTIRVLHTPGHSNGSVCYYFSESGLLFTGDMLMGNGFFKGIPQYTDINTYIESMKLLCTIQSNTVYCDHNESMTGVAMYRKALQGINCATRIDKHIRDFLVQYKGGEETLLGNAVQYVCAKEQRNVGGGACVTILSHLRSLGDEYPIAKACVTRYKPL